jgi:hypothetical protein
MHRAAPLLLHLRLAPSGEGLIAVTGRIYLPYLLATCRHREQVIAVDSRASPRDCNIDAVVSPPCSEPLWHLAASHHSIGFRSGMIVQHRRLLCMDVEAICRRLAAVASCLPGIVVGVVDARDACMTWFGSCPGVPHIIVCATDHPVGVAKCCTHCRGCCLLVLVSCMVVSRG